MPCDLEFFSGCVCHLEQFHAQSLFLFPIVFGINHMARTLLKSSVASVWILRNWKRAERWSLKERGEKEKKVE